MHLNKDDKGFLINLIELTVDAVVPKVDQRDVPAARREDQDRLHHLARAWRRPDDEREGDAEELRLPGYRAIRPSGRDDKQFD